MFLPRKIGIEDGSWIITTTMRIPIPREYKPLQAGPNGSTVHLLHHSGTASLLIIRTNIPTETRAHETFLDVFPFFRYLALSIDESAQGDWVDAVSVSKCTAAGENLREKKRNVVWSGLTKRLAGKQHTHIYHGNFFGNN